MEFLGFKEVLRQQLVVADMLNATKENGRPLFKNNAVEIPRRGTKSTSVWALMLGRCLAREDYAVGFTAQSGVKAVQRFKDDVVRRLLRRYEQRNELFEVRLANGREGITFSNGSRLLVLPPKPESARGDAFGAFVIDEAQEHEEPEAAAELLGAIRPTMLTVPDAQLIVMGTTGRHRVGMLWDALEAGRRGDWGIVEYAAPPSTPVWEEGDPIEGTTADPEVWKRAHPGIGQNIEVEDVAADFRQASALSFQREYLGLWPDDLRGSFIDLKAWADMGQDGDLPELPAEFGLGLSVALDGSSSALVAAWRVEEKAHLLVVQHDTGSAWLGRALTTFLTGRRIPLSYDGKSSYAANEVARLKRALPRTRLAEFDFEGVALAHANLHDAIARGQVVHYAQPGLNAAAANSRNRATRDAKKLLFGRLNDDSDITPIEAAALALRSFDERKPKQPVVLVTGAATP